MKSMTAKTVCVAVVGWAWISACAFGQQRVIQPSPAYYPSGGAPVYQAVQPQAPAPRTQPAYYAPAPVAQPVKAAAAEAPETAKKPRLFILFMRFRLSLGHFPISALMINRSSSS